MPEKSRLMPISYYNPKQEIRLSAYADTIVLEPDGREQHLRAIRFGGYPEMVRAMSDAIYAGATLETEFAGETAMLTCEPKKYECHLSHDGIYAEATILSLDDADTAAKKDEDAQAGGQTNVELPPRKCILFCPAGDRRALFEALDRKTAVPLIPEFQDYVLDELQRRRFLKPLRVISIRERLEAWLLLCKKDDANIVKVLEDGLKSGAIRIPGTVQNLNGFDSVHSVTSYLSAFGVTVAERIRNQFQPLFDPTAEQLSPEVLRINDYIRAHAGYSLYPAQLAVAESVKRKLSEGKSAFIVAECGSGKTKIGATALAAYQAQKWKKTFNIILCPSHVAKKWVREIAETLPDTVGVIVRSNVELDSLSAQYRQGDKSIYAVISKEKARDGYMRRPAVLFDARKGAFRCPSCGEIIELPSSDEEDGWTTAKPEAFRMENRRNHQCMSCDGPLWTAVNPSVPSPWVKIPEYGWVHRKLAVHAMQKTKNPAALDALLSLNENPDGNFPRISVAKFNKGYASMDYYRYIEFHDSYGIVPVQNGRNLTLNAPVSTTTVGANPHTASCITEGADMNSSVYIQNSTYPYVLTIDMQKKAKISELNLSTKLVNGSETAYKYTIEGSVDGEHFQTLVDGTDNWQVGFQILPVTDSSAYRYLRLTVLRIINVHNNNQATWSDGVYELTAYGKPLE